MQRWLCLCLLWCALALPRAGAEASVGSADMERLESIAVTEWTAAELAALGRGEAVARHWSETRGRSRGLAATLVSAPSANVWRQIVSFDAYVEFMPYVTASWVSSWTEEAEYTHILAGYHLTTMGITTRYRLDNRWYADRGVMLFDVAPDGSGPIVSGDGWWRVSPWRRAAGKVLLEYTVDMGMQWWVPGSLERKAADRLPVVVRLIKRRAESAQGR